MSAIAKPFGMLLMILYDLVNNYGLALILFAIVIRLILLPFQMKSKRGTMRQTRLQPKIPELQKKHGTNKQKINEEMAKLYKEEGVNPASGCLWGFLPLPIMFALFLVIREPLTMMMGVAAELLASDPIGPIIAKLNAMGFVSSVQPYYIQVDQAQFISQHFDKFSYMSENLRHIDFNFGLLNLGMQPRWNFLWTTDWSDSSIWLPGLIVFFIPFLSAGSQFAATAINKKINPPGAIPEGQAGGMQTFMMLMPLMSVYFAFMTPAALGFYWTIGTVLQILQDVVLTKRYTKILDAEEAVRNEERKRKEEELEAKRIETERKKAEGIIERNPNTSKRKKSKSEKQGQIERTAEWEKKNAPAGEEVKYEPSRVGNRRFARGRAYNPERYMTGDDGENSEFEIRNDDNSELLKELDYETEDYSADEVLDSDDDLYDDSEDSEDDDHDDDEDNSEDDDEDNGEDDDDRDDDIAGSGQESELLTPNSEIDDVASPTVRFDTTRFGSDEDKKGND